VDNGLNRRLGRITLIGWRWLAACLLGAASSATQSQTVLPEPDPAEAIGKRPYEMDWAHREEPAAPTVRFDDLQGWSMQVQDGAQGVLQITRAQNVWDRPVARLRYRGEGKRDGTPRVVLVPPQAVSLPTDADSVDAWVYGNRWDWENPPDTPPVRLVLHLRDGDGRAQSLALDTVRWKEWWLIHKRLPSGLKPPVRLEALEAAGGWQPEWREIFLDSLRFYREELQPLQFAPRPRRRLTLADGQSPGANTGPGRLALPTRERTILPTNLTTSFHTVVRDEAPGEYSFRYSGKDGSIRYTFRAEDGLASLTTWADDQAVGHLLDGVRVHVIDSPPQPALRSVKLARGVVTAEYADGTTLRLRIWQKSLVVDVSNRTGRATELAFGEVSEVTEPHLVTVPYLNYGGGPHPCVLLSRAGDRSIFTSVWLDWYRSNGSEPYAAESVSTNRARINGGVRYHSLTDGVRNPMFERLFLTVSPRFEEVLPTVPNPVGLHAREAVDRIWQESWGPDDFEKQIKRSRILRAYGIEKLIQCNHEIAWRDGGESFTLRTHAAPGKGGDSALQGYVAHQRSLGWLAGLYSNYTDFAPVNEFWSPDAVQRQADGNWRSAWPRCWALKPLRAVELDARLAPQIKSRYSPTSAYTDVHTAVAPWHYNDYDARVPGAGTFAQTFYAYGELLSNDSRVYGGPIFSEGSFHWLYAGLADGNYALAYDGRPLAKEPLLPVFDLLQIHPKECDIGMGWTANFCDAMPDWRKPENLDRAIDRFLLHTLAYGHVGWLVEEEHGLARTCRSYYMLQQVQARYGLKAPSRIAYWDGRGFASVSEAIARDLPRARRQLLVEYPGGLSLYLNDHTNEVWSVEAGATSSSGGSSWPRGVVLPPAGWAAFTRDGALFTLSGLDGTNRIDYLRSPAYLYLDGRGHWFEAPEAASDGALTIRRLDRHRLELLRISGEGAFVIRQPFQVRGACTACQVFDVEGKALAAPRLQDEGGATRVEPVPGGLRYVLEFSSRTR
jgi:hypothetical protein